jgi:hypothetical protein
MRESPRLAMGVSSRDLLRARPREVWRRDLGHLAYAVTTLGRPEVWFDSPEKRVEEIAPPLPEGAWTFRGRERGDGPSTH